MNQLTPSRIIVNISAPRCSRWDFPCGLSAYAGANWAGDEREGSCTGGLSSGVAVGYSCNTPRLRGGARDFRWVGCAYLGDLEREGARLPLCVIEQSPTV